MRKSVELVLSLLLGPALGAVAFNCIILPNRLLSSGVGGLAILINSLTGYNMQFLLIVLFLPILIWAVVKLGYRQIVTATVCYVVFTVMMGIVPHILPEYQTDPIVAAMTSGVLLGISGGIVLRLGVANGPEALMGVYLKNKYNIQIGSFLMAFNVVIIAISLINSDLTLACYSMVSIYMSGKVTDRIIIGFNRYLEVNIISESYIEITEYIQKELGRGVTFIQCMGTYELKKRMLLITLVSNVEIMKLKEYVNSVDKNSFIYINESAEVIGKRFIR